MRMVFMGTPEFAAASLVALAEYAAAGGSEIVGVYTREDKPAGRGHKLTPPPVKVLAQELGIPVYQPRTLRDDAVISELRALEPELIVVVAYGRILPREVLDMPRFGCINVHGSLLPEYRGAAPMQRAMIEGRDHTGITTMYMDEGIDTGDMLLCRRVDILPEDDFGALHDRMAAAGAELLRETLAALEAGTLTRTPQPEAGASYAAKLEKEDCIVDFTRPARELADLVRGLSPQPLARAYMPGGKLLKLAAAHACESCDNDDNSEGAPGEVIALSDRGEGEMLVRCGRGVLAVTRVVPEGKGKMTAAEFIRGRRISIGDRLK